MTEKEILDRLNNDEDYYGEFGSQYLSQSKISTIINEPYEFYNEVEHDHLSSANLEFGTYFHALMLEPYKAELYEFVDVKSRRTNKFKEAWEENNKVLTYEEHRLAMELANIMQSNNEFAPYIYDDNNTYETPGLIKIQNTLWKGKADIVTPHSVIDLKTSSNIQRFQYSFKDYYYSCQAWLYEKMFGKPVEFFVACKKTKMLGKFRVTSDWAKQHGEDNVLKAIEYYNKYIIGDEQFYVEQDL